MRRALVSGLTIAALSITVLSQSTNNKADSKDKPEEQSERIFP
jgi:hypothetical protein